MNSHPYWKKSFLVKAINGFMAYQLCSILSLINPVYVDRILYQELKDQFRDN